ESTQSVLVVEDNELNMRLFCDLLDSFGYKTFRCHNGGDALQMTRATRPDLIIMDIQLPGTSGLDITRSIKDDPDLREIPVLAVTAFAMRTDEERVREAGCEGYLSKPIQMSSFIRAVEGLMPGAAAA
ncbi:MAG: response regulator, partial [Pseudomonadota bacterium]